MRAGVLEKLNERLVYLLLAAAALLAFCLGFLVVADVIGRSIFNSPVRGTPEIVSMSIVVIAFLLAAYAVQSGGMIYAAVLVNLLGWRGPVISTLLSAILGTLLFGLIAWGGWDPLVHAITTGQFEGEGALRVPVWPARLAVMVGAGLVMLNYVGQGVVAFLMLLRNEPPADGAASQPAPH